KLDKLVSCIERALNPMEAVNLAQLIRPDLKSNLSLFFDYPIFRGCEAQIWCSSYLPQEEFSSIPNVDPEDPEKPVPPEVNIVCFLLLTFYLIDKERIDKARECSSASIAFIQKQYSVLKVDGLASIIYYLYVKLHEENGELAQIQGKLHVLHQRAKLRREKISQDALVHEILHYYLKYNLYDQAHMFISKQPLYQPSSNMELSYYKFYSGRIQTIRLEYRDAKESLEVAAQLASFTTLVEFRELRLHITIWSIMVRLLLGEIPEKSIFKQNGIIPLPLIPYLDLRN
ncbi:hypothetical protein UlMin_034026, partial [Ulmus minor]